MLKVYKKRLLVGLIVMLFLFAIIAILALLDLNKGIALFGFGFNYRFENIAVIILSLIGMFKVIHEIIKVEHQNI
ncbi:MAG: hypothetical protein ABH828_04400 [archaeon]